ncbi:N-acyltransferase YncA, partial [Dysosmobacter welbionis]
PQYEAAKICGPAAHRPDDRGGRHLRLRCGRLRGCRGKAAAGGVRRGDPLLRGRSAPALGTGHHRHLRRMLRHRVPEGCCGAGSVRQGGGGGSLRLRAGCGYHRHWRYRQRLCGHRPAARLPLRDPAGAPSPDGLPGRCGKPAAGLRPRRGAGRYGPGSPAVRRPGPEPG